MRTRPTTTRTFGTTRAGIIYTIDVPAPSPSDPKVGDRVEAVGMCCPGSFDRPGTIVGVRDSRWGRSYRVQLDDGGEEHASDVAPRGTRGVGWRYL